MSQQSWIGKSIGGRFTISELLGQGGMSAVYKANDPNLRRVVAIKLIHPHLSSDPEFVRRFEEEAAAVASLRHPNIIQVFDFNHDGDTFYIVFEFIPGESLQAHLKRVNEAGRLISYEQTIKIAASVADALDYAHQRGIIHRDVKAANVMLNVQGEAILMDFGLVKIAGGDSHTATGAVMGTARYMSPEQIKGHQVDGRSDIYSLGVMLYEMVAGRPPFQADSALTLLMMHVNDPVPDVRQVRPNVSPDLMAIINKALAKDRAERFQSAGEMAAALRAVRPGAAATGMAAAAVVGVSQAQTMPDAAAYSPTPSQPQAPAAPAAIAVAKPKASSASPPPPAKSQDKSGGRSMALIGGLAAAFLVILCIAVAAIIFGTNLLGGGNENDGATETAIAAVQETQEAATAEPTEQIIGDPLPTEPVATATTPPTTTEEPTPSVEPSPTLETISTLEPTPTTAASPTVAVTAPPPPTEVPAGPQVRINSIVEQGGSYVVDYTPIGYTPALPGTHIHFFWNTVPPQNAGVGPTQETWILYGGPNPFKEYTVGARPAAATQMCALVANSDHTVQLNTGNCANLP